MKSSAGSQIAVFGDEIAESLEEQLQVLAETGVRHLELRSAWGTSVVDLSEADLARAGARLREAGVGVAAIASPVGKAPIDGDFEEEMGRLRSALAAAERLGTRLIRVFSFFILDGDYERHREEVLRRMAAFAREAEAGSVTLVHENDSYTYGDTAERCRDLLAAVGSPALRAAFDPANFVQVGVRPHAEAWPLLAEFVAHFHVKDAVPVDRSDLPPYPVWVASDRLMASVRPAGEGVGELPALIDELVRVDYDGLLVIEPHLHGYLPELSARARFELALGALRSLLTRVPG